MSGNTEAARIWDGADTYVDLTGLAVPPTDLDTPLDELWLPLGIITQDGGISFTNSVTETEHYGHGNVLLRTTYGQASKSFALEAVENNDLVWRLKNPGSESSTEGGITKRVEHPIQPSKAIAQVVLALTDGDIAARRWMPKVQFSLNGDEQVTDQAIAGTPLTGKVLAKTLDGYTKPVNGIDWTNDPAAEALQLASA